MTKYVNGIDVEVFKPIWEKAKERMQTVKKARNQLRRDVDGECYMCVMGLILDTAGVGTWSMHASQPSVINPEQILTSYQFDLAPKLVEEMAAEDPFYKEYPFLLASIPSVVCAAVGLVTYRAQNFTAWNDLSSSDDWEFVKAQIDVELQAAEARQCS